MLKIRRALISVYDKRGIVEFAETLHQLKTELVASSGTATLLKMRGLPVTEISELTSHPEILEGRVKTLHPLVHGGILADKTKPEHLTSLKRYGIKPIDMVVVNLYPFEKEKDVTNLNGSLEYMDIGGNTLLRAAAKNFKNVAVVTEPELYAPISEELKRNGGALTQATLLNLAIKALTTTFQYELSILNYLQEFKSTHTYEEEGDHFVFKKEYKDESSNLFPHFVAAIYEKVSSLRYGENPHQKAALYRELKPFFPFSEKEVLFSGVINGEQLQGKALSYNNYVDLDGAVKILLDFDEPTAVVIKHTNPCGLASASTICEAYKTALATDPMSAFGGVVGLNRTVDQETAKEITSSFKEAVIAPDYQEEALKILAKKKKLRVVKLDFLKAKKPLLDFRSLNCGIILQETDELIPKKEDLKVVTKKKPSKEHLESLLFGWKVVKHVKSNAIVFIKEKRTVGIGAGQMSRVDAVKIAAMKAGEEAKGSVMASDAFFPFRDGIDAAHQAGVVAIIQPGGSIRDHEIIEAADEHNMIMVFTGVRSFNH